jgi:hypothetical protein
MIYFLLCLNCFGNHFPVIVLVLISQEFLEQRVLLGLLTMKAEVNESVDLLNSRLHIFRGKLLHLLWFLKDGHYWVWILYREVPLDIIKILISSLDWRRYLPCDIQVKAKELVACEEAFLLHHLRIGSYTNTLFHVKQSILIRDWNELYFSW